MTQLYHSLFQRSIADNVLSAGEGRSLGVLTSSTLLSAVVGRDL